MDAIYKNDFFITATETRFTLSADKAGPMGRREKNSVL